MSSSESQQEKLRELAERVEDIVHASGIRSELWNNSTWAPIVQVLDYFRGKETLPDDYLGPDIPREKFDLKRGISRVINNPSFERFEGTSVSSFFEELARAYDVQPLPPSDVLYDRSIYL